MDRARFVIMELSSNGFGSPEVLANERADLVMNAHDYLRFKNKFERQTYLLKERN